MAANNTSNRGFGSMDPDKQQDIARQGGKAAHEKGTAHEFDSESGRKAGSQGGKASHASDNSSRNGNSGRRQDDDHNQLDE